MRRPHLSYRWRSRVVRAYLRHLAALRRPVFLGPWRSEVGFEILYWEPFLKWALAYAEIAPDQCIALSRGGMGCLYPAERHVDLYTLRGVDAVRQQNQIDWEDTKLLKQVRVTEWDRQVCREAAESLGVKAYGVLHPSWMYWLFEDAWNDSAPLNHLSRHATFTELPRPEIPNAGPLPPKYVAVRFYERPTFPLTDVNRQFAEDVVAKIAARMPVILLNQTICADDHSDFPVGTQTPNVYAMEHVEPHENLAVQAAVIAGATAFVGTYGGVAQWAQRYGKPTVSFYTTFNGTNPVHLALSERLAMSTGVPFEAINVSVRPLLETVLSVGQKVEAPA